MRDESDQENLNPKSMSALFDQLYRANLDLVYKLALGLTGNVPDAEEVTQETFLKAFRSYHTFREECAFSTWIYRIAINVSKDYLRQRAKFPVPALTEDLGFLLEEVLDPNPDNDPEAALLANLAKDKCLHSLTECLPLEQRKVFCLAITLGLPHKLVAEILDCSPASVKTSLHRAKARWFGYMEDRCQLINKSGSCSCKQWVRFGLSQGWFSAEAAAASSSADMVQVKEDIGALKALRLLYQSTGRKTADESYVKRIREGIESKEWGIFC